MTAGRPLTELLAEGPMGSAAIDLLTPLAAIIDDLHCRGSVHGHLGPDCVVVGPDGRPSIVPAGRPPGPQESTDAWSDQPVYAAPDRVLSHRGDLFSFACLAFHAITGSPPHTLASVRDGGWDRVPRATSRDPGLPTAVDEVFRSALHPVPTERSPSAGELVTALRDAFGGRYRPPAGPALRRSVAISAVAAAVALTAAAVTAALPVGDRAAPGPGADPATTITRE